MSTPTICLDMKKNRIRIHRTTLRLLGNPEYVHLLVNPEQKQIAVHATSEKDPLSFRISEQIFDGENSYELYSRELLSNLCTLETVFESGKAYRLTGKIHPQNSIAVFSMSTAVCISPEKEVLK